MSLARVKSSLLDEEVRWKEKDISSDSKALLTEFECGRQRNRSPQNRDKSGTRSKSRGRPTCFYCGKPGHFQKNYRNFRKDKETDSTDSKKSPERNNAYRGATDRNGSDRRGHDRKGTTAIAASEEELMLITEESELNLVGDETTWVVDFGTSFHLTLDRKCFNHNRISSHNKDSANDANDEAGGNRRNGT